LIQQLQAVITGSPVKIGKTLNKLKQIVFLVIPMLRDMGNSISKIYQNRTTGNTKKNVDIATMLEIQDGHREITV
jgi:hypothetical protein